VPKRVGARKLQAPLAEDKMTNKGELPLSRSGMTVMLIDG